VPSDAGRRLAERTTREQGLPLLVEDEATLRRVIAVLTGGTREEVIDDMTDEGTGQSRT
jgi:hypothetical protein